MEYTPSDFLNYYSSLIVAVGTLSLAGLFIYQNRKLYEQETKRKIDSDRPIFKFSYRFRDEDENQYIDIVIDNINNGKVTLLRIYDCILYINGGKSEYTKLEPLDFYASENFSFKIVEKDLDIAKDNLTILSFSLVYRDLFDYSVEEIYEVYRYASGSPCTVVISRNIIPPDKAI